MRTRTSKPKLYVNRRRPTKRTTCPYIVIRRLGNVHVGRSNIGVWREIRRMLAPAKWRALPGAERRGFVLAVLTEHA